VRDDKAHRIAELIAVTGESVSVYLVAPFLLAIAKNIGKGHAAEFNIGAVVDTVNIHIAEGFIVAVIDFPRPQLCLAVSAKLCQRRQSWSVDIQGASGFNNSGRRTGLTLLAVFVDQIVLDALSGFPQQ